jgi:uncharacterized protein (DUF58 family)
MSGLADAGLLLDPALRARLADLVIRSRRTPSATRLGQQASRSRGAGLEFAQYRGYEPGDEPRQIDWKLYARSDRLFVREAERESPLSLWLLLDASASMGQADAARPGWTRLHAARQLAACCIEIALRQGDAFGVCVIGGALATVPPAAGSRQRDRCLLALRDVVAAGAWPTAATLAPLWQRIPADALVVWLSDAFDTDAEAQVTRLAAAGREVLAIQILTTEERDFPFTGPHRFRDPETGELWDGDAASTRAGFLERFAQARGAQAARMATAGIRRVEYIIDQPADAPLRALFGASPTGAR